LTGSAMAVEAADGFGRDFISDCAAKATAGNGKLHVVLLRLRGQIFFLHAKFAFTTSLRVMQEQLPRRFVGKS